MQTCGALFTCPQHQGRIDIVFPVRIQIKKIGAQIRDAADAVHIGVMDSNGQHLQHVREGRGLVNDSRHEDTSIKRRKMRQWMNDRWTNRRRKRKSAQKIASNCGAIPIDLAEANSSGMSAALALAESRLVVAHAAQRINVPRTTLIVRMRRLEIGNRKVPIAAQTKGGRYSAWQQRPATRARTLSSRARQMR
jgi:hypothetical protein